MKDPEKNGKGSDRRRSRRTWRPRGAVVPLGGWFPFLFFVNHPLDGVFPHLCVL